MKKASLLPSLAMVAAVTQLQDDKGKGSARS
jgi:hypothetical protein